VQDLTAENSRNLRIENKEGVVVTKVEPGSAADDAGLNPGDVIAGINRQKIENVTDYQKATKGLKGDALVELSRGFVVIKEK
jgi:S1-C subfamily serine protease